MKFFHLVLIICFFPLSLHAQDAASDARVETIVDKINKPEPGKGSVQVIQDESITNRLDSVAAYSIDHGRKFRINI